MVDGYRHLTFWTRSLSNPGIRRRKLNDSPNIFVNLLNVRFTWYVYISNVYFSRRIENILEKLCVMFANIQKFDVQCDKIKVLLNAYCFSSQNQIIGFWNKVQNFTYKLCSVKLTNSVSLDIDLFFKSHSGMLQVTKTILRFLTFEFQLSNGMLQFSNFLNQPKSTFTLFWGKIWFHVEWNSKSAEFQKREW